MGMVKINGTVWSVPSEGNTWKIYKHTHCKECIELTESQKLSQLLQHKYPGKITVDRLIKICVNDSLKEKEFFSKILEHSVDLIQEDNTKFTLDEIAVLMRSELLNHLNIFFPVKLIKDLLKIKKLNIYEGHYTQLRLSGGIVEVIIKSSLRSKLFADLASLTGFCFVSIIFFHLANCFLY